jgi:hypothetical protein
MGNMTVAGTGHGLLGPAQGGFNPAMAGPRPGMDDPNALTPAMRPEPIPRNEDGPGYGRPDANRMGAKPKPMAAPAQPGPGQLQLSPANGGGMANVPMPPNSADRPKAEGPWGANPFKAAWADGVQGGSWGAPDDRFVGAFANAAMPAQRGLLWPFSN